jgi:Bacteriophage replication protein O
MRWPGFENPNYTPIPDEFFDVLMTQLSEAELRILLYICRRTFGFRKRADAISINQMLKGITTRDGRQLDNGAGLSKNGLMRGLKGLIEKEIIFVEKAMGEDGVNQVNIYGLRFREGVVPPEDYGSPRKGLGVVPAEHPQQTVRQQTEPQERLFETSNGQTQEKSHYDKDRDALLTIVSDFAKELGDTAPLSSTLSRTVNLYRASSVDFDQFVDILYAAKTRTQEHSSSITKTRSGALTGAKSKTAYWFKVVESLLEAPKQ